MLTNLHKNTQKILSSYWGLPILETLIIRPVLTWTLFCKCLCTEAHNVIQLLDAVKIFISNLKDSKNVSLSKIIVQIVYFGTQVVPLRFPEFIWNFHFSIFIFKPLVNFFSVVNNTQYRDSQTRGLLISFCSMFNMLKCYQESFRQAMFKWIMYTLF